MDIANLQLAEAIVNIKSTYGIKRNWQGDPCGPEAEIWNGLRCNSDVNSIRIVFLYCPFTICSIYFVIANETN